MNLRKTLVSDWPVLLILLIPFALTFYFWDQIPERIAMHWNAAGEVDRWGEKGWKAFLLPVIGVGVYLLLIFVPYIDPKKKTDNRQKAMRVFRIILPLFFTAISIAVLYSWLGGSFQFTNVILLGIGALFLFFGNYMQTLKPNYFIGIRTPWTLESEENWRKTHRVGGKIWVAVGLLMLISWFFVPVASHSAIVIAGALIVAISTIGYSFYLYLRNRGVTNAD